MFLLPLPQQLHQVGGIEHALLRARAGRAVHVSVVERHVVPVLLHLVPQPAELSRRERLDIRHPPARHGHGRDMAGKLVGLREAINLVGPRIPRLLPHLEKAVPVAEGDVVKLVEGKPAELDGIGLPRLLAIDAVAERRAPEGARAAVGNDDPRPLVAAPRLPAP